MIGSLFDTSEALVALLYGLTCYVAGVAWAAYRALGWVERIRTWAHTVPCEVEE